MKKIQSFNVAKLRIAEDYGFMQRVQTATAKLTGDADAGVVTMFKAAVTAFDEALKASQASAFTEAMTTADELADTAWRSITATAKAQLPHPVAEARSAAQEAVVILKKYGDVTAMPYNEEYGNIPNALQDFAAMGVEKQKLCYIDAWVEELQKRYDEFTAAQAQRTEEQGAKVQGIVKTSRTACDESFRTLVSYVNAMVAVSGETAYADFIDNVNVIIDEAKATLAARATRSGGSSSSSSTSTSGNSSTSSSSSSSSGGSSSSSSSTDDGGAEL